MDAEASHASTIKMMSKLCKLCSKIVVTRYYKYYKVLESLNNLSFVFNEKHDQTSMHNPGSLLQLSLADQAKVCIRSHCLVKEPLLLSHHFVDFDLGNYRDY